MRFACCKILFGKTPFREFVKAVASMGFDGVEAGISEIKEAYGSAKVFSAEMEAHGLKLAGSYWGGPFYDPAQHERLVKEAVGQAEFLRNVGSQHLVIGPPGRFKGFEEAAEKYLKATAQCLDKVGAAVQDQGVLIGLHNHYGCIAESRREIDFIMANTDPTLVGFAPDTCHLAVAGCDVLETIRAYSRRVNYVHLKDATKPGLFVPRDQKWTDRMRELGRGKIDFPAVMKVIKAAGYDDWAAYEQDFSTTTAEESARISKRYIDRFLKPLYK